ncbi:MAG TPA: glycerophosphodiester phosphodiesterase [Gemmatimonadaceae bacterium]|nr:glycerophosphodiester phosphodiesterase [Gemmatimonadaceae bacterium]
MTPSTRTLSFAHPAQSYYHEERLTPGRRRDPPQRISHRGAHQTHPENSLAAFERAIELGADAIELDVHATRDGVVVVHHDPEIRARHRQKPSHRAIAEVAFADLEDFPLADGARIPTLAETLDTVGDRAIVYVEIKAPDIEALVTRCIRESGATCAVHSFDHRIVQIVKTIFPAIRTGILENSRHVDAAAALIAVSAEDLWQEVDTIDEGIVESAHSVGGRVIAWTANEPSQWDALYALGVDGICTDRIAELATYDWQLR